MISTRSFFFYANAAFPARSGPKCTPFTPLLFPHAVDETRVWFGSRVVDDELEEDDEDDELLLEDDDDEEDDDCTFVAASFLE